MARYGPKGGARAGKETMAEKVAKHRKPRAAREGPSFGEGFEAAAHEEESYTPGPQVSDKVVGNLFTLSVIERATIQVVIGLYDKKLKAAVRNARECQLSEVELSRIRSRCALVTDELTKAATEDEIEFQYPLRTTLGAACSLHMRWLKKELEVHDKRLIDKRDLEKAMDVTQRIANKIGEQLVLFIEAEEDE